MLQQPSVTLKLGPMRASKSTELLRLERRATLGRRRALVLVPQRDTRVAVDEVTTHDRDRSVPAQRVERLCDVLRQPLDNVDTVLVDEVQFFEPQDARDFVLALRYTHQLVLFGLNGRADLSPWPTISALLPLATAVELLSAVCMRCGADASTSHYRGDAAQMGADGVCIGDTQYESLCLRCHPLAIAATVPIVK